MSNFLGCINNLLREDGSRALRSYTTNVLHISREQPRQDMNCLALRNGERAILHVVSYRQGQLPLHDLIYTLRELQLDKNEGKKKNKIALRVTKIALLWIYQP